MPAIATQRTSEGFAWDANPDGTYTIRDVPLFCTCTRGADVYDEAWIRSAFSRLRQADAEGHLPPVTLHHDRPHRPPPKAVGFFRATRVGPLPWRGVNRPWIFADLVVTDPTTFAAIAAKRIPYRSVDVDRSAGEVVALALLDYEPPYVEGPMTFLRDVAAATKPGAVLEAASANAGAVLGFARWDDGRTVVLMEAAMPDEKAADEKDPKDGKPEGEKKPMEDKPADTSKADRALSLVEKLSTMPVPLEDASKVIAGLQALLSKLTGGGGGDAAPAKPSDDLAEPQTMSKDPNALAQMQQQIAEARADAQAAKASVAQIRQERTVETLVRSSLAELAQFAHVETEETLRQAFTDFGGEAGLKAYVARLKKQLPENLSGADSFARATSGAPGSSKLPKEVADLKCETPEEGELAMRAFREYEPLAKAGHMAGISFARYFETNRSMLASLTR